MTFLIVMLVLTTVFLMLSLAINIAAFWYLKQLLKSYRNMGNAILKMRDVMHEFAEHISSMYKKELYRGDPTIRGIVAHAKEVVEEINLFAGSIVIEENEERPNGGNDTEED